MHSKRLSGPSQEYSHGSNPLLYLPASSVIYLLIYLYIGGCHWVHSGWRQQRVLGFIWTWVCWKHISGSLKQQGKTSVSSGGCFDWNCSDCTAGWHNLLCAKPALTHTSVIFTNQLSYLNKCYTVFGPLWIQNGVSKEQCNSGCLTSMMPFRLQGLHALHSVLMWFSTSER